MFLEPNFPPPGMERMGWVEVVCGSMFSGKTEELIRRMRRAKFARQQVRLFKHGFDTRFDAEYVVSHDQTRVVAQPVLTAADVLAGSEGAQVVGIDEAQFFGDDLIAVVDTLANNGIRVIVAGLDMDYLGQPFGPMPHLMAMAEYVTKLHAICTRTGQLAHYSLRKSHLEGQLMLGEKDQYEPVSRPVFHAEMGK